MKRQQIIRRLERTALDGHRAGQSWRAYFAGNVAEISGIIRSDPAGWSQVRDRLLALLVSGDQSGRLAVGDADVDLSLFAVVQTISDTATEARCLWSPQADKRNHPAPPLPQGGTVSARGDRRNGMVTTTKPGKKSAIPAAVSEAIEHVLGYLWHDEIRDYGSCRCHSTAAALRNPGGPHVFIAIANLRNLLDGTQYTADQFCEQEVGEISDFVTD